MQETKIESNHMDPRAKEAFKTLRTNIEFSGDDMRVICITSTTPNEGKSTVAFELACTFAENGLRTLFIDADLRKSVIRSRHRIRTVKNGLSDYLASKSNLEQTICVTDMPNLFLVVAGTIPPNPPELLGNKRFRYLIDDAKEHFDIVIIDTPPIGSVIDAAIVSKVCDGCVLVVGSGDISYKFAKKAKEQMEATGSKIIGCVLNKVNMSQKGYYGKYYGQYYGNEQ